MKRKNKLSKALKEAVIIVSVAAGVALIFNQFRSHRLNLIKDWTEEGNNYKNYRHILKVSLDNAKQEFEKGEAVFLDGRSEERYLNGHIPNALNLPFDALYEKLYLLKPKISINTKIIVYDEGEMFPFSIDIAYQLKELGFQKVVVFLNGWSKWKNANLPFEKGKE